MKFVTIIIFSQGLLVAQFMYRVKNEVGQHKVKSNNLVKKLERQSRRSARIVELHKSHFHYNKCEGSVSTFSDSTLCLSETGTWKLILMDDGEAYLDSEALQVKFLFP